MTTHVLDGAFTLEMERREPVPVKAGEAMVEPPNARMTGYNRSVAKPMTVGIFYVSEPDTPFLEPIR